MNMRQVWGLAGGFFAVYILITVTNRPVAPTRGGDAPGKAAAASPAAAVEDVAATPAAAQAGSGRLRGFTLLQPDGSQFAGAALAGTLSDIAGHGASWVALQPKIQQPTGEAAEVAEDPAAAQVLEDLRSGAQAAKAAGLKVMLRPLLQVGDGTARDRIAPPDAEAWVASWSRALQPYLALAESEKVEVVCLGSRLGSVQATEGWLKLIGDARAAYSGKLTYAASHEAEAGYRQVPFWTHLDYVGIDAFFPLTDAASPQAEHLEAGWARAAEEIEAWRPDGAADRPVLFTSAGVPYLVGGAADPGHPDNRAPEDEKMQAAAYEAFFKVMWAKPWLAGVFWHTWNGGPDLHDPYALAGRPALEVVRTHFGEGAQ